MSSNVTSLPASRALTRPTDVPAMALEEIRGLVRDDLTAVDTMIRSRLKSVVPLVDQIADHIIGGGGKRLRPLLSVLAGRACGIATERHVRAAALLGFVHTATLP